MRLEEIRQLTISSGFDRGGQSQTVQLQRSWPLNANHLLLEYRNEAGIILPGQWNRDPKELDRLAAAIGGRSDRRPMLVNSHDQAVLLQPEGLDGQLRSLTLLLRSEKSQLLSHRPGKRAIVRWQGTDGALYCKLFATDRNYRRATQNFEHAHHNAEEFRSPEIRRAMNHQRGLVLSSVDGTSLHLRLKNGDVDQVTALQIGRALRRLHSSPVAPHLRMHRAADEAAVLAGWTQHVATYLPDKSTQMQSYYDAISACLSNHSDTFVVSHRDLYDKQILITPDRQPGLIDFDTMAMADPALDPANLLAHLELRVHQRICDDARRLVLSHAILQGYGGYDPKGLQIYLDSARLRLACVYGFRPHWQHVMSPMLARIGRPWDSEL